MKKMRVVFLGLGRRAMAYARPAGADERFEIVAAADADPVRFRKQTELFGGARLYDDWRRLIDEEEFDMGVVCTPDFLHEEMAVAVLERGKHLMLEKPMALTPDGCLRIIEARRKARTKLLIGFVLRYNNLYRKTRELVADGAIGNVKAAWVEHSVTLNYFHNWMSRREMSGGLLLQKATHDIDLISWIVDSAPLKVSAFAGLDCHGGDRDDGLVCPDCDERQTCPESRAKDGQKPPPEGMEATFRRQKLCAYRREINVFDNHVVNILYENGVKASYSECHFTPIHRRHFTFIGDKGQVTSDSLDNTVTLIRRWSKERDVFDTRLATGGHGGGDTGLWGDLCRCLFDGGEPVAGAEAGFLSVLAGEAGERSALDGGRVIDLSEYLARYRELTS